MTMSRVSSYAWWNGQIVPREQSAPSVASISFHMGTGVFDGLMAYCNDTRFYLHRAEEHIVRFKAGAAAMGMPLAWSVGDMLAGMMDLLAREGAETQYIRPIAFRGAPELWLTGAEGRPVDVCIFTVPVMRDVDGPIRCHLSPVERVTSLAMPVGNKVCGTYVNSFMARKTAEQQGYDDGIMLDRRGHVAEASAANVFFIRDGCLFTPLLTPDVFPGITRRVVLEICEKLGRGVEQRDIRPADLKSLEGAFLCSTLMELRPVSVLGSELLGTIHHPVFKEVLDAFRAITHQ